MTTPRLLVVISMIVAAAASRLIPHPPNLTAVTAAALFAGATLGDRRLSLLVPLAAMAVSDAVIGFSADWPFVYASFAAIVGIGMLIERRRRFAPVAGAALASSLLFFVVTNFGVWAIGPLYPRTLAGLVECYVAAIPFFGNTLGGDLFYTALLFGGLALLERGYPVLRATGAEPGALPA
jgi:hypothetical protein